MTDDAIVQTKSETCEVLGHVVTLTSNWKFTVSGPEFENDVEAGREIHFNSFVDARNEISRRISESEKIRAQKIKLDVIVLTVAGERVRVSGIDRRTGDIPKVPGKIVYPDIAWIATALATRKSLLIEIGNIERGLREVEIPVSRAWGRIDAENYGKRVMELEKQIKEQASKAREMGQPKSQETEPEPQTA